MTVRNLSFGMVVTVSSALVTVAALSPAATFSREPVATQPEPRLAAAPVVTVVPIDTPVPTRVTPSLDIDVAALMRHVDATTELVGHSARELASKLGSVASVGADIIEWNVADLGIAAGSTYGYASIVDGRVTGIVFRGRATLDRLQQIHVRRPVRLTMAGGDRPSFSIDAGE